MTRQIEMVWNCSTCSRRNRGRDMVCTGCGDPKDASESYEMPSDTANAPSVTDPELLRKATAGPNWRCSHCGSDQRRTDGACVQCGGTPVAERVVRSRPREWPNPLRGNAEKSVLVVVIVSMVLLIGTMIAWIGRTRTFDATVVAVHWEQRIVVDRYQIWPREGWRQDVSDDAFDIVSLGQQIHHYDTVFDGYDAERYLDRVACGQDCRTIPQTCHESCSSNDNGFATCREICSGGGQSCDTRYCDEWRVRHVPRYRDEPRYAERIRYRIWDWGYARTVVARGDEVGDVHWPERGAMPESLPTGERERERREGDYTVTLGYDDDETVCVAVDAESFGNFSVGSSHTLVTHFRSITVDGMPLERAEGCQ